MNSPSVKKSFLYKTAPALFVSGLAFFGLSACGEDPTSPDTPSPSSDASQLPIESSDDVPLSQEGPSSATSSSQQKASTSSSRAPQTPVSSSSKTATVSSEEVLNEPQMVVNGSCGPKTESIEKGGMATWSFYRESGDVFESIMAPFVWSFPELGKTVQGNGMNSVNISYEQSGTYTAKLNVDGSEITCSPLRVQGIPITVKSCKAAKNSVNAGETITWTVDAESESEIVGYEWSSDDAQVSGSGTSATMLATGDMHKKNVKAVVTVTNKDKTVQDYTCESVSVVDPNQVDVVIAYSVADETKAFTGGQTLVAQYPSNAVNCQLICSAQGNGVILEIDGEEFTINWSENITPTSCKDGSAAGTKLSVKASMQVLCYVAY